MLHRKLWFNVGMHLLLLKSLYLTEMMKTCMVHTWSCFLKIKLPWMSLVLLNRCLSTSFIWGFKISTTIKILLFNDLCCPRCINNTLQEKWACSEMHAINFVIGNQFLRNNNNTLKRASSFEWQKLKSISAVCFYYLGPDYAVFQVIDFVITGLTW